MARREVDVVIGAKTDDASFRQTEQKTKGFLSRLRGTGGTAGGGAENVMERTNKAIETMGRVTAAVVLLDQGLRAAAAGFEMMEVINLHNAGQIEKAAERYEAAAEKIRQLPVFGPSFRVGEMAGAWLRGDPSASDIKEQERELLRLEREKQKTLAMQEKEHQARERLEKIISAGHTRRALAGLDNEFDREIHAINERIKARLEELDVLRDTIQSRQHLRRLEEEDARIRLELEKQIAEVRKRQQQFLKDQVQGLVDFFKTGRKDTVDDQPGDVPFRAGLPGVTQGLLLSGQAEAARTKSSEAVRREQLAQAAVNEQQQTNRNLIRLIQLTEGQAYAPVLN